MPTRGPTPEWTAAIRVAEAQFGVVSAGQLLALGASRDWVKERLRRRQLRPVHRDVYAVGHSVLRPQGRWLAAALAVPGAVLSHRTASTATASPRPWTAGPRKARKALAPLLDDGPRTRSELERAFVRMARRFGLGTPQCKVWVVGLLVDAYWSEHRLVVECDSRRWHASWAARRNDHARDARL
jgi:hypothetical protein